MVVFNVFYKTYMGKLNLFNVYGQNLCDVHASAVNASAI